MSVSAAQWGRLLAARPGAGPVRDGTWVGGGVYFGAVDESGEPIVGDDGLPLDGDPSAAVVLDHVAGLAKGDRVVCAVLDKGVVYVLGKGKVVR